MVSSGTLGKGEGVAVAERLVPSEGTGGRVRDGLGTLRWLRGNGMRDSTHYEQPLVPQVDTGESVRSEKQESCERFSGFFEEKEFTKLKVAKDFAETVIELRKKYKIPNVAITKALLEIVRKHEDELKALLEELSKCKMLKEAEEIIRRVGGGEQ